MVRCVLLMGFVTKKLCFTDHYTSLYSPYESTIGKVLRLKIREFLTVYFVPTLSCSEIQLLEGLYNISAGNPQNRIGAMPASIRRILACLLMDTGISISLHIWSSPLQ